MLPVKEHGPVSAIGFRIFVAVMCVVVTTVVVYLEREDYRDLDGTIDTWLDALYYATVTLSTTGYGDITPVTEAARPTNIVVITPLRFIFLIVLVGTTIEVLTERSRQQFRTARWRKRVKKHTVVIGYGMKGRSAVSALMDLGYPADHRGGRHQRGQHQGGHRRRLRRGARRRPPRGGPGQAAVSNAHRVIVAADRDDTSVLVTLTARRLTHGDHRRGGARGQNIAVLRQSGATW